MLEGSIQVDSFFSRGGGVYPVFNIVSGGGRGGADAKLNLSLLPGGRIRSPLAGPAGWLDRFRGQIHRIGVSRHQSKALRELYPR